MWSYLSGKDVTSGESKKREKLIHLIAKLFFIKVGRAPTIYHGAKELKIYSLLPFNFYINNVDYQERPCLHSHEPERTYIGFFK